MTFRNAMKNPAVMTRAGLAFLLLALLMKWLVHPVPAWQDPMDGVMGFAFGVAIALMLLALRAGTAPRGTC